MLELIFIFISAFLIYMVISPPKRQAKEQQPSDPPEVYEPAVIHQAMAKNQKRI